ncbi:MAG: hypothetical protein ACFE8P_16540, partial [Promethearchaeota archaeon]
MKTIWKLLNFEIESKLDIFDGVWIENNLHYKNKPNKKDFYKWGQFGNKEDMFYYGSYDSLSESAVIIGVQVDDKDLDNDPFNVEDSAYVGLMLSIYYDNYFVTCFGDSSQPPYTTLFYGCKKKKNRIKKKNHPELRRIYYFVSQGFKESANQDFSKIKLLELYSRVMVRIPYYSLTIMKVGLQHLLNPETTIIANSAIFFEHIFTRESEQLDKGVEKWNDNFPNIDKGEIKTIMNFRHKLFHDNATNALNSIEEWKKSNNYDERTAIE